MNHAKHARELIDSSKAWLASAELDTDERKWKKANLALAEEYLRLRNVFKKLTEAIAEIDQLRDAVRKLGGFAATVRKENTDEWMQLMANALNRACEAIGDSDRFAPFRDGIEKEERT